jgi:hypothetical protein
MEADPAAESKSVKYSRSQHVVEFQCEVEVTDPWRIILAARSGALFWTGQRRVSPQLKKASLT